MDGLGVAASEGPFVIIGIPFGYLFCVGLCLLIDIYGNSSV